MEELHAPITSIHLRTSSGVWNLLDEFNSREDHPYKYGYGMLFHGGYHYVDVLCQFLRLNALIYPQRNLAIDLHTFAAFPHDQPLRIPETLNARLEGYEPTRSLFFDRQYGETDIVTTFKLYDKESGRVLTLGTLSLEQTTPGMRSWAPFPVVPYNINGRLHCTDIEVQLSTVYSMHGRVFKIPVDDKAGPRDLRGKNLAQVSERANALLMGRNNFYSERVAESPYGNSFSYQSESAIFDRWLANEPTNSEVSSHLCASVLLTALCQSINEQRTISVDFAC